MLLSIIPTTQEKMIFKTNTPPTMMNTFVSLAQDPQLQTAITNNPVFKAV